MTSGDQEVKSTDTEPSKSTRFDVSEFLRIAEEAGIDIDLEDLSSNKNPTADDLSIGDQSLAGNNPHDKSFKLDYPLITPKGENIEPLNIISKEGSADALLEIFLRKIGSGEISFEQALDLLQGKDGGIKLENNNPSYPEA